MGRTLVAILILLAAILFLPVWVQIVFFVLAVLGVHYRIALIIPAIISDIVYAPNTQFSVYNFKMTILVVVLLVIFGL